MRKKILNLLPIVFSFALSTAFCDVTLLDNNQSSSKGIKEGNELSDPCCNPQCEPCKACEICPPCEPCCEPCCTEVVTIGEPCNCAYNAPARIDPLCGWDTWFSVSFLYYQAKEDGLDLGLDISYEEATSQVPGYVNDKYINLNFDYHPAFKVGAGFSMCRDDWTLYLEYTRFFSKDTASYDLGSAFDPGNRYLLTSWIDYLFLGSDPTQSDYSGVAFNSSWKLSANIVDLELGRPYYLGKKLIFKPYYGLRGGTIDQKYNFSGKYQFQDEPENIRYFTSDNKSDSWILGPRAGLDTEWLIGCNFTIFGNIAASLLYQKFDLTILEFVPDQEGVGTLDQVFVEINNSISYLNPNLEFELGIGYGSYFCNNKWYLDLSIGYFFDYFWKQNMIRPIVDANYMVLASLPQSFSPGDLRTHGLNITARLDF